MRDYGKVHTSFWSSATIRSMSEDARTLAIYLLTSPHNTIAGVFRLPDGYVCEDLQWGSERVSKGFAELFQKGFANRCETTKWVWICKHMDWNQLENPNQRKAAAKIAASIPDECGWKLDFMRVGVELMGFEMPEKPNPSETVSKPFRNQKQEQKQEQKQDITEPPDGVSEKVWHDFLKLRKAKKAPVTETAIRGIWLEAEKAGMSLNDALATCCKRGWQGFEAAWLSHDDRKPSAGLVGAI